MITVRRKFSTKITRYGISSFHFYFCNQSIQSHSPGLYTPFNELPKFRPTRVDNTSDNNDITQSQAANHHRLLSHVTLGGALSNAGSK